MALLDLLSLQIIFETLFLVLGSYLSDEQISVFRVKTDIKFKSFSSTVLQVSSKIECVLHCQNSNCCAVTYSVVTNECYLENNNCYDIDETEVDTGWQILRMGFEKTVYISKSKTWHDAETYCELLGGHLATVTTPAKHNKMIGWRDGSHSVWVGASDINQEGNWTWHNPTQPMLLNYWATNRPDNSGGDQNCLCYCEHVGYIWDDRTCSISYHFICDL